MGREGRKMWGWTIALIALGLCFGAVACAEGQEGAGYTLVRWVEKANFIGTPGDPAIYAEDLINFERFDEETREAAPGAEIALDAESAGAHLRAPNGRRFASFISAGGTVASADGTRVVNAYYARDTFTVAFALGYEEAEMEIGGVTYTGAGEERYTVTGKYGQKALIPGTGNGLMPKSSNENMRGAECVGWLEDARTGNRALMTYSDTISDAMLPTDDMPYGSGLVVELTGVWFTEADKAVIACWYEELPEEEGRDLNRRTYNGKTYINYPATNFEMTVPRGAAPRASSAPGLISQGMIDPPEGASGAERMWEFFYDRERFEVSFDSGGAGTVEGGSAMYGQNLYLFDPGWGEGTTRAEGGATYVFSGWYLEGVYVSHSLSGIWMSAQDMRLSARWEAQ